MLAGIWERYVSETPQRVKLLDTFMAFLVLVGALQFVYCVLVGNYVSLSLTLSHLTSLSLSFFSFFLLLEDEECPRGFAKEGTRPEIFECFCQPLTPKFLERGAYPVS